MPLGTIPPWLDIHPADFLSAAESGARLGEEAAQMGQTKQLEEERMGEEAAQSSAAHQLEAQRQAAEQNEAQQRLALETQAAARKFQAQQAYQQAVNGGADPIDAMMKYGPLMGQDIGSLGSLALNRFRTQQASMPPQMIPGTAGQPAGYTYDGRFYPSRPPSAPAYETITTKIPGNKGTPGIPEIPSDESWYKPWTYGDKAVPAIPGLPATPDQIITKRIPITLKDTDTGEDADDTQAAPAAQFIYDPKSGEFSTNAPAAEVQ